MAKARMKITKNYQENIKCQKYKNSQEKLKLPKEDKICTKFN